LTGSFRRIGVDAQFADFLQVFPSDDFLIAEFVHIDTAFRLAKVGIAIKT